MRKIRPLLLFIVALTSLSAACASAPEATPDPPATPEAPKEEAKAEMDPTEKVLNTATARKEEEDMFGGAVDTGNTFGAKSGSGDMAPPEELKAKTLADAKPEPLQVTLGQPAVTGGVDSTAISVAVKKREGEIQACYKQRLAEGKPGNLIVTFTVKKNGGFEGVTSKKSTLDDEAIEGCVLKVFEKTRVTRPKATGTVIYPVLLQ